MVMITLPGDDAEVAADNERSMSSSRAHSTRTRCEKSQGASVATVTLTVSRPAKGCSPVWVDVGAPHRPVVDVTYIARVLVAVVRE